MNELLDIFPIFQYLPSKVISQLTKEAEFLAVPKGKILFQTNSLCTNYPLLLKGSMRVISISEQGRELLLYRVLAGELCIISSCLPTILSTGKSVIGQSCF
jgi:CRP/FNR family transcriptional regulator, anaerobic regulatory protein